jgi:hypothetical protein
MSDDVLRLGIQGGRRLEHAASSTSCGHFTTF